MGRVLLGRNNIHPMLMQDISMSDYKNPKNLEQYQYYKQNGGKLPFRQYRSIKKRIFIKLMEHVYNKGKRIDLPFFGEIFIQETKVPVRESKNSIKNNDHFIAELVLQRYNHSRIPMNFYQDIELTLAGDSQIADNYIKKNYRHRHRMPYKNIIQYIAIRAKRIDKNIKFVKSFKKHEDYVYPDD